MFCLEGASNGSNCLKSFSNAVPVLVGRISGLCGAKSASHGARGAQNFVFLFVHTEKTENAPLPENAFRALFRPCLSVKISDFVSNQRFIYWKWISTGRKSKDRLSMFVCRFLALLC
jgi:hypothetical protein